MPVPQAAPTIAQMETKMPKSGEARRCSNRWPGVLKSSAWQKQNHQLLGP
jgi:hypothetical protein